MKTGGSGHPKLLALAKMLSITRRDAVGLMELLWEFTAKYTPAGDIGKNGDVEIAAAVEWPVENAGKLIRALTKCGGRGRNGFLERSKVHRLIVHDWPEHAPEFVRKRVQRERLMWARGDDWQEPVCPDLSGQRPPTKRSETEGSQENGSEGRTEPDVTQAGHAAQGPVHGSPSVSLALPIGSGSGSGSGSREIGPVEKLARRLADHLAPGTLAGDGKQAKADAFCIRQWANRIALAGEDASETAVAKAMEIAADGSVQNPRAVFAAWFKGNYGTKRSV